MKCIKILVHQFDDTVVLRALTGLAYLLKGAPCPDHGNTKYYATSKRKRKRAREQQTPMTH